MISLQQKLATFKAKGKGFDSRLNYSSKADMSAVLTWDIYDAWGTR
jgi:hypothetical protein